MQNEINKKFRSVSEIVSDLREFCQKNGITQAELAKECKLNQSQVSRLLDGKLSAVSKGLVKLCNYASISVYDSHIYDPSTDKSLMDAIRIAVGNSASRARKIERVLRALQEI